MSSEEVESTEDDVEGTNHYNLRSKKRESTVKASTTPILTTNMSTNVVMTHEMLQQLLAGVLQANNQNANVAAAVAPVFDGNFVNCKSRFSGNVNECVNAFIDAIMVYKQCARVSDESALLGLSMLLDGNAGMWWQGAKASNATWLDATQSLRHAFGRNKPPYQIYRELFATEQGEEPTDIFVNHARALLAKLPSTDAPIPQKSQIDMIYGLLNIRIRRGVPRDVVDSFETLIDKARSIEANFIESFRTTSQPLKIKEEEKQKNVRPKCTFCNFFGHTASDCRKRAAKEMAEKKTVTTGPLSEGASKASFSCYGCGIPGYIRSNCPQCKTSSKTASGPNRSVDLMTLDLLTTEVKGHASDRPLLEVEIEGLRGLAILDTGAKCSIAGKKLLQHLKKTQCPPTAITVMIALADGEPRKVDAIKFDTGVYVRGRQFIVTFIAMPQYENSKTLLGIDFIRATNLVIDIPRMQWYFAESPTMVYDFHQVPSPSCNESVMNVACDTTRLRSDEANHQIDKGQHQQLQQLLHLNADVFRPFPEPTPYAEHSINVTTSSPTSVPPYRLSPAKKEFLKTQIDQMIADDVIEECESPYSAPVVLVPKKDGKLRLCIDYRALNAITIGDSYPLPRIDDLIHAAEPTLYMSTLDLKCGYWQISVKPADRDKTAFVSPFGMFRFKRMPFGLKTAPATFQRMIDKFRAGLPGMTILAYLDDLILLSPSFEKHLEDLKLVFDRLRQFKLCANRDKCSFACTEVKYLGHRISRNGISVDPDKVAAIANLPKPNSVKHLLSFVQTASWFRRFIPEFAKVAQPLTDLTKKNAQWIWGDRQQDAFDTIKRLLTTAPILRQADATKPYLLRTDASSYAIGACLLQGEGPDERPVEYASRLLTSAERNYTTTEREALAVVFAVQKFRGYIEGCPVRVVTDHQALRWLMSLKSPTGRLARWALLLQTFDLTIEYMPGRCNVVADALSRPQCTVDTEASTEAYDICTTSMDLPKISSKELRGKQLDDPDVKKIIDCFENPTDQVDFKRWTERGYVMLQGVLYRYSVDVDSEDPQLVIPKSVVSEILFECHDAPMAGHYGVDKTLHRITSKYYWPTMRRDVTSHVRKCVQCQRYKPDNLKPAGLIQTPVLSQRFEVLALDLFGPLPETEAGSRWIYIIEDPATKWVELFALKVASAEMCARVLIDEVILRYGTPRRVISDNGTQFVAEVMQYVAHTLGFTQNLIPLYHPEANPVERRNRDLKTQLAIYAERDHHKWDEDLPSVRFAMNSARSSATGFSAAQLCFGRELRTPGEVNRDLRVIIENENFEHEIGSYLRVIADNLSHAHENCERRQDASKTVKDRERRDADEYLIGDKVLVAVHALSKASLGFSSKLAPRRDGPYVIMKKLSPTSYQVATPDQPTVPLGTYHASALRRFVGNEGPDPSAVVPIRKRGRPRKNPIPEPK